MKARDDLAVKDGGMEEAGDVRGGRDTSDSANEWKRKGTAKDTAKRRKGTGEIDCWRRHVDAVEADGVKQEIISESALKKRKIKRWYMGNDSFMLEDGHYAYRDCNYDVKGKPLFYRVLTVEDEELARLIRGLHAMDREEGRSYRAYCLHQDYGYENYKKRQNEEDEEWTDPIDTNDAFGDGSGIVDDDKSRPFPVRSEYAVIRAVIKRMTPADREVYEMLFESLYTEAEIKSILDLGDSAWTNRKNRFLEKIKRIFVRLGYDVDMQSGYEPTLDVLEDELNHIIEDLEEKKGDFEEDDDDRDAGDAEGSADKKKPGKRESKVIEDIWRSEIRNDMRQENRRNSWM